MARKGGRKSNKRLAASKAMQLQRKEFTWTIRANSGPHSRQKSMPIGFVLRDLLHLAANLKEVKFILNKGIVSVDGRTVRDYRFPVGLFDLISTSAENKTYRVLFDRKGRLVLKEEKTNVKQKLCKVIAKGIAKKGLIQLHSNDGRTFSVKKSDANIGDSLLVRVPQQSIEQQFRLAAGNTVLLTGGTNVGMVASIKKITEATMQRQKLIALSSEGKDFQTTESNVFVVGEKKPAIEVKVQ